MFSWRLFGIGFALLVAVAVGVALAQAAEAPAALRRAQGALPAALRQAQDMATPIVREFAVVTHPANQGHPAISGNIVVWVDRRNGNYDIYGKDLSTGREFAVVTHTADQYHPAISGNIVVWQDDRKDNWDIYGKDLSTGREFAIVTHTAYQLAPAISGNIVVWEEERNGPDIYGKNLTTGEEFPVSTNPGIQWDPAISGNVVVWMDQRDGCCHIYAKDLASGREFAVSPPQGQQEAPAISGNVVIWQDDRNGSWDIYGKNLATGEEFAVTTGRWLEAPAIGGDVVVWGEGGSGSPHMYGKNLASGVEFPISTHPDAQGGPAISGETVVWSQGPVWNTDIYGARLSWPPLQVRSVQAHPNPFRPTVGTTVSYTLTQGATAALFVLDWDIAVVRTIGPIIRPPGPGAFLWDGRNQAGQVISSGLYIPIVVATSGSDRAYAHSVAVADDGVAPAITNVAANPSRLVPPGGTTVTYRVSKGGMQVLLVLNALGAEVRQIVAGYKRGGPVSIPWDGQDYARRYVPNGSYILVPIAVDVLGRVGWSYTVVQVGNVTFAISPEAARKLASAWVEAHRDELAGLVMKEVKARLSSSLSLWERAG